MTRYDKKNRIYQALSDSVILYHSNYVTSALVIRHAVTHTRVCMCVCVCVQLCNLVSNGLQVMLCIGAISITTFIFSFAITAMILTHEARVLVRVARLSFNVFEYVSMFVSHALWDKADVMKDMGTV